jgi:hypothetical protein
LGAVIQEFFRVNYVYRKDMQPDYQWNIDQGENQIRLNGNVLLCKADTK